MESAPANQHYVPQFLLRRFASSASGNQIFVFDKANERSFSTLLGESLQHGPFTTARFKVSPTRLIRY